MFIMKLIIGVGLIVWFVLELNFQRKLNNLNRDLKEIKDESTD